MTKVTISEPVRRLQTQIDMRLCDTDVEKDLRIILAALKRSNEALAECAASYEMVMDVDATYLDLEMCAGLRDTAEAALSDEIEI